MIVTLDSGILIRATGHAPGPARRILELLVRQPEHTLVLSPYILSEVGKGLAFSKLYTKYRMTPDEVHDYCAFLRDVAELVDPMPGMPVVLTDPKDDPVLYTAIAASSDVLCTIDKSFFQPNVTAFAATHDLVIMRDLPLLSRLTG